jgi:hypothetical protein
VSYLLDADVFIRAKNDHYGFDTVPAFWEWIDRANENGRVFSVQRVRDELLAGDDKLADWARSHGDEFFLPPDDNTVAALTHVSTWANGADRFRPAAVATFLRGGDYYLVGHALAHGYAIVTHEMPAPQAETVIKIPDACIALGIPYLNPFTMLRNEGARFVLG